MRRINRFGRGRVGMALAAALAVTALAASGIAVTALAAPVLPTPTPTATPTPTPIPTAPHLQRNGAVTQLMVNNQPYLVLAGELQGSTPSTLNEMDNVMWPLLGPAAGLNTLMVPVSWAQWEPTQGHYDTTLVDDTIIEARTYNKHIAFVWFGSWKNSDSSYAPSWIKADRADYPLSQVQATSGPTDVDVLSPFGMNTEAQDAAAYAALMAEIHRIDAGTNTVLFMQVENEVGLLSAVTSGTPSSRDLAPLATAAWNGQVPAALTAYLTAHVADLQPAVASVWTGLTSGTWTQVFGTSTTAQEIFMAWAYSTYVNAVAAAGKAQYNIPMYVNTWIVQPSSSSPGGSIPGQFPDGGPVSDMHDVWRAGAPSIDILAPDIYLSNFSQVYAQYCQSNNQSQYPCYVSEGSASTAGSANAFYAIGQGAIGYSPFGIDSYDATMKTAFTTLQSMSGLILAHQQAGTIWSTFLSSTSSNGTGTVTTVTYGDYNIKLTLTGSTGYAIVMADPGNKFTLAGAGIIATVTPVNPAAGPVAAFDEVQQGTYVFNQTLGGGNVTGTWTPIEFLNGDATSLGYYFGDYAGTNTSPYRLTLTAGNVYRTTEFQY